MKNPKEIYESILKKIQLILKPYGYSKSGPTFYLNKSENWGLINFQKSMESSGDHIKFTINVGTCSTMLRRVEERDVSRKPPYTECHWSLRIGFFLPAGQDHWWSIDERTNEDDLVMELSGIFKNRGLREIESHISDEQLEEYWKAGNCDGLTDYMRIVNLTLLMKAKCSEGLPIVAEQLREYARGKSFEKSINGHLNELGV